MPEHDLVLAIGFANVRRPSAADGTDAAIATVAQELPYDVLDATPGVPLEDDEDGDLRPNMEGWEFTLVRVETTVRELIVDAFDVGCRIISFTIFSSDHPTRIGCDPVEVAHGS